MKRFFIYGGCVTRDVFNSEFNSESQLIVCDYIARYSVAKLCSPPISIVIDEKIIPSKFQRNILKVETENKLIDKITNSDYDYFVMDFMFFRYKIYSYIDTYLTGSKEILNTGLIREKNEVYSYDTEEYWRLFEIGIDILIKNLKLSRSLDKLRVNKIFLATHYSDGELLENVENISKENQILQRIYDLISTKVNQEKLFIDYPEELFVADKDHHWGKAPMHFVKDFYRYANKKFSNL